MTLSRRNLMQAAVAAPAILTFGMGGTPTPRPR